ncbi:hypothetical protein [Rhodohalobacter sulfatireducens]|uniref:Uncharacterized protein n=1 Tax=Rhodohalobacter sulfatireducens TaxID=2911366 RepID=A0ABS9KFV7_9BACT|nr:hypothetical protein [Rhodohalobacter sulfatireducens]MCG2589672.1 hypothetical protein [Rhodohalobacter sulfatireducens]MDR9364531.1 hypothetical protein [Balneolaceae bacterium]MDR9409248.1 hypothetical protein [Balneolaceae bacterium]
MEKDRSLKNALRDKTSAENKGNVKLRENEAKPVSQESETPKEDIIDKLLRGILAFFGAIFFGAVISGIMEVAQGWQITFGSLPMITITAILYYPTYKALTWMGFFRQR